MAELKKNMPEGVDYQIVYDPTQFVARLIEAVIHNAARSDRAGVLVVILFLQTWRASIIRFWLCRFRSLALSRDACVCFFDQTHSVRSDWCWQSARVDDAIVVVENVERNIEGGLSPRDATYQAMREVSGPIIAIALC